MGEVQDGGFVNREFWEGRFEEGRDTGLPLDIWMIITVVHEAVSSVSLKVRVRWTLQVCGSNVWR